MMCEDCGMMCEDCGRDGEVWTLEIIGDHGYCVDCAYDMTEPDWEEDARHDYYQMLSRDLR